MKYFNVFKQMYAMYLSIRKSYRRDCNGFNYVKDQKSVSSLAPYSLLRNLAVVQIFKENLQLE
jgi:hypothetical protein